MKDKITFKDIFSFALIIGMLVFLVIANKQTKNDGTDRMIVGVHIKGEVNAPGYYELDYGSRIKDAVNAACGETLKADLKTINLAARLVDGEEIIIPAIGEEKGESVLTDKININTADLYKLCKLEGIGESIAQDIIDYRTKNGLFNSVNDLKKIKGIGSSKFKNIKEKVTVD